MISFKDFIAGKRDFKDKDQIAKQVTKSKNFKDDEDIAHAKVVELFENSNQKTYLIKTNKRLYKILDDRRKEEPMVNWSVKVEKLINEKNKNPFKIIDYKKDVGKLALNIDVDKGALYTKKLFSNIDINEALTDLLENKG
jgi:uncharacterized secreted protein with C-terminal beta-propeller domain